MVGVDSCTSKKIRNVKYDYFVGIKSCKWLFTSPLPNEIWMRVWMREYAYTRSLQVRWTWGWVAYSCLVLQTMDSSEDVRQEVCPLVTETSPHENGETGPCDNEYLLLSKCWETKCSKYRIATDFYSMCLPTYRTLIFYLLFDLILFTLGVSIRV